MKTFKNLLCVLLAVVMIAVPVFSITASATDKDHRNYPTIEIAGFMAGDIYATANDTSSEVLWPISSDFILGYVKQMVPMLAKFALTWNWDKLGEETTPLLKEMLGTAICDTNGDPIGGSGVNFTYPPASSLKKSSVVTFRYDWRLDPILIASQINDFVEYVCASTGSEQVCIRCHSLGGVMTLTYITLYGDSRIHSIVMNSTAVFGETYNGELMTGQMKLSGAGISEYLQYSMDDTEYEELVDGVMVLLEDAGLLDFVAKFGDLIISKLGDYWIPEVVIPMFAYSPAIWAMVPDQYVEQAKDYVFNNCMAGNGVDYSALIAKIDSYGVVRENRVANLNKLNEDANLYVIARYGYSSVPLTPSWDENSDGVIDTKNASYGATVTKYGTIFADDYITDSNREYISPDKTVDASTCMFPEQTWFIKNLGHSKTPKCLDEFFLTLLHYDGQANVNTFAEYPRFMEFDGTEKTLSADTSAPIVKETGFKAFVSSVRNFFKTTFNIFKFIINLIS